jgi:hypothetical protein
MADKTMSVEEIQKMLASAESPVFGYYNEKLDLIVLKSGGWPQTEKERWQLIQICGQRGFVRTLERLDPTLKELTAFADECMTHAIMGGHAHLALWLLDRGIPWEVASPVQDPDKGLKLCEEVDAKRLMEWGVALWKEHNPEGFILLTSRWERDHLVKRVQSPKMPEKNPSPVAL